VNVAISFQRKRKTRKKYHRKYSRENTPNQQHRREEEEVENERAEQLYNAISTLNASEKAIITMYLEGFSYAEIAYVTDLTENYVGVRLNRIRKKLSNKIKTSRWNSKN